MGEPDGARPDGARAGEPRPIQTGQVVGGVILGLITAFLLQFILSVTLSSVPSYSGSPVLGYVVAVLPGVLGVALLLNKRTRQAGAGALLGLAVGSIVAAGVCTALAVGVIGTAG